MEATGLVIILLTAAVFSAAGVVYARRVGTTLETFVVARNTLGLTAAAATLIASGMGAWILFSPAEATVSAGILGLIGYALGSGSAMLIFMWVGVRLRRLMPQGHALTEYVLHRFGAPMYVFVLVVMVFYMGVYLAAELSGMAMAAHMVFNVPLAATAGVIGLGTLAYTAIGGFPASVFTDRLQSWVILPLLAVVFVASIAYMGGPSSVMEHAAATAPQVLDLTSGYGFGYAVTLIIAIIAAELFNQVNWQRVYAPRDERTLKASFLVAGVVVAVVVLVAGLFGILAAGHGEIDQPSVALFQFLLHATPNWLLVTAMVLAVTLVMSSMDSLLNGLASLFTVDLVRVFPRADKGRLLAVARWFTVLLAALAVLVATRGWSVLYLFLVADLVCAAAVVPTYIGLFARRISGRAALAISVAGLVAGAAFFPGPAFSGASLLTQVFEGFAFGSGNLLKAFVAAAAVPAVLSVLATRFGPVYDFSELQTDVHSLDQPSGR